MSGRNTFSVTERFRRLVDEGLMREQAYMQAMMEAAEIAGPSLPRLDPPFSWGIKAEEVRKRIAEIERGKDAN